MARPKEFGKWSYIQLAASHKWRSTGSALGPVLCHVFISDLDKAIECTPSKCADVTKLRGKVDLLEGRKAVQRGLERLCPWAQASCVTLSKAKCHILRLGHNNPTQRYRVAGKLPNKDLGVMNNSWLNTSHQCVQVAK